MAFIKSARHILAVCALNFVLFPLCAERVDSSGKWKISMQGDEVILTGFAEEPKEKGLNLVVPATIDELPVVAIGAEAFYSCNNITSVTIPDGVKMIGERAFMCCESLVSAEIPVSVRWIGSFAFNSLSGSLKQVHVPRCTHIYDEDVFSKRTLVYIFRGSQAAGHYVGSRNDFVYEKEGAAGDVSEYSREDYSFWKKHAFAEADDGDSLEDEGYGYDEDDDENLPDVTTEELAAMVDWCLKREEQIVQLPLSNNAVYDEENKYAYVRNWQLINLCDVGYKIPYHYLQVKSTQGGVPNFIYIVYGRPTSSNIRHFTQLMEEIAGSRGDDDTYEFEDLEWSYKKARGFDITYSANVMVDGMEYEVLCTDVDGN